MIVPLQMRSPKSTQSHNAIASLIPGVRVHQLNSEFILFTRLT
ncbi:MAG TPA: hypothetical protein V6D26_23650 [Stenomitos sp.]